MKTTFTIIFTFFTIALLYSQNQKVTIDDNAILIDKVKYFNFIRMKKGGLNGLTTATLSDLDGKSILVVEDSSMYLSQLPYETEKREYFKTHALIASQLNKTIFVQPIFGLNIRKDIMKKLDSLGFFKTKIFDEKMFNKLAELYGSISKSNELSKMDTCNVVRFKNTEMTSNKIGPTKPRKPGTIHKFGESLLDGKTDVADIERGESGKYASIFEIYPIKSKILIAKIRYIPSEKRVNIVTEIDGKIHWFPTRVPFSSMESPVDLALEDAATYLIHYGYL